MTPVERREEPPLEPSSELRKEEHAAPSSVRLRFGSSFNASAYLSALTGLLFSTSTNVIATLASGAPREDLTAAEIADLLARNAINTLHFDVRFGERTLHIDAALLALEPSAVELRAHFSGQPATSCLWLQSDTDVLAPMSVLALATTGNGLATDAAHSLVGLALRCGGFEKAELFGALPLSWNGTKPNDEAQPVCSKLRDAVWSTSEQADGAADLWVNGLPLSVARRLPEPGWWELYEVLTRRPREALTELHDHIAAYFDIPYAWAIVDTPAAPECSFMVQPEANAIARLVPEAARVIIAIDLEQPASMVAGMLLHLCAHLALGHVRPGDTWGHWDTPSSLTPTPHRQWDRDARKFLDAHFARPIRRVTSLEECNPREKEGLSI